MSWFANLIPAITGFLGGAKSAPSPSPGAVSNSGLAGDAVPAPPGQRTFGQDLKSDAQGMIRKAIFAPIEGRINGRAQRALNNSAFPGTTPWEQLAGGATSGGDNFSDGMNKNVEIQQRERESQRAANTTLQTARMGATERLATSIINQGGVANVPLAAEILRRGGVLPPEFGLNPKMMAKGRVEAEIGNLNAQADRSREMLPYDQTVSTQRALTEKTVQDKNRVDIMMRPLELALNEWKATSGSSYTANEVRGWLGIARQVVGSQADTFSLSQALLDAMNKSGVPEGDMYLLRKRLGME